METSDFKTGGAMAVVSVTVELITEIPLTINEAERAEGQSYVDLVADAATAFMENTHLNQLDFQVKIVGDVIAAGE
jgi:hypothetical protein